MIYLNPVDNLRYIIRQVGVVTVDQLIAFFAEELYKDKLRYYLDRLEKLGEIDLDPDTGYVHWHRNAPLKDEIQKRIVKAFWIVVYFGNRAVRDVNLMKMPFYLEVILQSKEKSEVYDIAICNSTMDGTIASRQMQSAQLPDVEDEVVHLVIVPDEDIGQRLEPYGFDSFITFEKVRNEELGVTILSPIFTEWGQEK